MGENVEGKVYLCTWEKKKTKYSVWVKDKLSLKIEALSFQEACDLLLELILSKLGDGEAVLDFDKPIPDSKISNTYLTPELYKIAGNAGAILAPGQQELFTKGICSTCNNFMGERTLKRARFISIPSSSDGAVSDYLNNLYSEEFLNLFTKEELEKIEVRPVIAPDNSKKKFYELIGPLEIEKVASKKLDGFNAKKCKECGYIRFGNLAKNFPVSKYARSDLPKPLPSVFVIGTPPRASLCFTGKRWREIQGKSGTKNMSADRIALLQDDEIIRINEALLYLKTINKKKL